MPGRTQYSFAHRALKSVGMVLLINSLSLSLVSCQTGQGSKKTVDETRILESRKDIIQNALNTGNPHGAMRDLRLLIKKHPKDVQLQSFMGLAMLGLKNYGRASYHFRNAYKIQPTISNALNLSSAMIEGGESVKSIKLLKSLLKRPDLYEYTYQERIYHNLGYGFQKLKRFSTAEKWFKKALVENPGYFQTHLQLARVYQETNRPALARREYRRAIDYCRICYEPIYGLTREYLKIGRYKEARLTLLNFSRVEGITPSDKNRAQKMINWVRSKSTSKTRISRDQKRRKQQRNRG